MDKEKDGQNDRAKGDRFDEAGGIRIAYVSLLNIGRKSAILIV